MEPIIYLLPISNKIIELNELDFHFENQPSPKLIKYGFNNMGEQLDLIALTSVPYYKAGLTIDFDRTDDLSIYARGKKIFDIENFDQTFSEFWEIMNLFGMLNTNQNILTNNIDTIKDIVHAFSHITNSEHNFTFNKLNNKSKEKAAITATTTATATLVIHKYSTIDLDENAAIQLIINDLSMLLNVQIKNANMVLQLFNLQTQITVEMIYYLSSLYNESYLIKPNATSDLFDSKYLILIGLKDQVKFPTPKNISDAYLINLGIDPIPKNIITVIQCFNSDVIPKKYKLYYQIKSYIDTGNYEGATYQEMIQKQNINMDKWLDTYTNLSNMKNLFEESIKNSATKCNYHAQWIALFNQ